MHESGVLGTASFFSWGERGANLRDSEERSNLRKRDSLKRSHELGF